jgi:hypothetical protein
MRPSPTCHHNCRQALMLIVAVQEPSEDAGASALEVLLLVREHLPGLGEAPVDLGALAPGRHDHVAQVSLVRLSTEALEIARMPGCGNQTLGWSGR